MSTAHRRKSILTCVLVSLVMLLLLSTFVMGGHAADDARLVASTLWTLYLVFMVFMILRTGRTRPWRSIFFIIYAFSFVFIFISDLIAERGSMALTAEIIAAKETPLCPVAIPQLILPVLLKKLLIFPTQIVHGRYGGFWAIFFMWLVGFIVMGRGWCSWACFFGGLDEGFSKILRRPLLSTKRLPPRLRYLPHTVLLVIVIWSFLALEPAYCTWFCPLKLVTEYPEMDSPLAYLQAIIFITLGMGLLFILPLLTKKRTQCGLFCPMGAMQSLMSPLNPHRVRIDPELCRGCQSCVAACPTFSMLPPDTVDAGSVKSASSSFAIPQAGGTTETIAAKSTSSSLAIPQAGEIVETGASSLGAGSRVPRVSHTCTRCGECMSVCPEGAIDYALVGVPTWRVPRRDASRSLWQRLLDLPLNTAKEIFEARTLFIAGAVVFGGTISGGFVTRALVQTCGLLLRLFGLEVN